MPRIPQGEFDQNPSSRVGAMNVHAPETQAVDNLGKGLANLTGAMAALQDQAERTEAYSTANKVKQDYLQKKATYMAALESSNGSGMADFFDPNDQNPDVSKRKRIQRPVQEMYKEMVDSYEEAKKEAGQLTRGDIAHDLMSQYVGDDLIQLQMQTSKHINRVREKEVKESLGQNLLLNLTTSMEKMSDPSATPEVIQLELSHMNNKVNRELGAVANILGVEETKNMRKLLDRQYASMATQILSSGVTDNTVLAADGYISRIQDPAQRSLAMTRVNNVKKTTTDVKFFSSMNAGKSLSKKLNDAEVIADTDYVQVNQQAKNILNAYTAGDPIKEQAKYATALEISSTALAKKFIQDNLDMNIAEAFTEKVGAPPTGVGVLAPQTEKYTDEFGIERERNVIAERGIANSEAFMGKKMQELDTMLSQEIEASEIGKFVGGKENFINDLKAQTLAKMKQERTKLKDRIPDIVEHKYAGLPPHEKMERISNIFQTQGLGEPVFASDKYGKQFRGAIDELLVKNTSQAITLYRQEMLKAGDVMDGDESRRRALATDIVGKDTNLAFLIPAADAPDEIQVQMFMDAAAFKEIVKEDGTTEAKFNKAFAVVPDFDGLESTNKSTYAGMKQAIIHHAAGLMHRKLSSDPVDAVKKSAEHFRSMYTSVGTRYGSVLALNTAGNIPFAESKKTLEVGMERAASLSHLSKEEKLHVLSKTAAASKVSSHTPDADIDLYLRNMVTIKPDARYPNMHKLTINGAVVSDKSGNEIKVSTQQIFELGQTKSKEELKKIDTTNTTYKAGNKF